MKNRWWIDRHCPIPEELCSAKDNPSIGLSTNKHIHGVVVFGTSEVEVTDRAVAVLAALNKMED